MTTPTPQRERTERSTNALLEAASELIVEGGFASLTFAAVGERAGYSRGLVTARFGSKAGLVDALIDRIVTTWSHRNVLPRTREATGIDALSTLLDAITRQAARDPRGLRVLYALTFESAGGPPELRARFAEFHEVLRTDLVRMIRRGRRDGTIRPGGDAAIEAGLIVGGLRGIGLQWLLDPDAIDPVPLLAHLHDTTITRLAPDAATAS